MLERLLELDRKGIIAPDNYTIPGYVSFGNGMLDYCRDFPLACRLGMPVAVERKISKCFKTDLSWAVIVKRGTLEYAGRVKKFRVGLKGAKAEVPVILLADGSAETLFHECIHVIRAFVHTNRYNAAFEEAFADYAELVPWHNDISFFKLLKIRRRIRQAEKRLSDYIGDNAGYAVIRLTQSEVCKVNESSNALQCFKSFDRLRHRIIKERLGI